MQAISFQLTFPLATLHKSRSPILPSKKGFRIYCVNGTLFIYRYASSRKLDFQCKKSQIKLFHSPAGRMGEFLVKVGCLPLPLLQLKGKSQYSEVNPTI